MEEELLALLQRRPGLKARELADLLRKDRRSVNQILFRLQGEGSAEKAEDHTWRRRGPISQDGPESVATDPPPRPSAATAPTPGVNSAEAQRSTFEDYVREFHEALDDEIKAAQESGGSKAFVVDGKYVGTQRDLHTYLFTCESELKLPDDVPINLEYQRIKVNGVLLSKERMEVVLGVEDFIEDTVPQAILHTEPWFLLEALQNRLLESSEGPGCNRPLAMQTLSNDPGTATVSHLPEDSWLPQIEAYMGPGKAPDQHKRRAVSKILASTNTYVWGPPGTGKTFTLGMAVAALVDQGRSVLVTAHSNAAVDVAMLSAASHLVNRPGYQEGRFLRFGPTTNPEFEKYPLLNIRGILEKQSPELIATIKRFERSRARIISQLRKRGLAREEKKQLKVALKEVREALSPFYEELRAREKEIVGSAKVIAATLSKSTISEDIFGRRFDFVIVDEVSMAFIPHVAFTGTLANSAIAVFGDFRQLAPIAQAETEKANQWLKRDVFQQAGIEQTVNGGGDDPRMALLAMQYRMHPEISAGPNQLFYQGRLEDSPDVAQRTERIGDLSPLSNQRLALIDSAKLGLKAYLDYGSYSHYNPFSALLTMGVVSTLRASGAQTVGVVTPYAAQARLLSALAKDEGISDECLVATVHRFQGSEQEVIVFDGVDDKPMWKLGVLLRGRIGSTAMRLINVAVTRAKGKFVGLFNREFFRRHLDDGESTWEMLQHMERRGAVTQPHWEEISQVVSTWPGIIQYHPNHASCADVLNQRISTARKEIALSFPAGCLSFPYLLSDLKQASERGVKIFAKGEESLAIDARRVPGLKFSGKRGFKEIGSVLVDQGTLFLFIQFEDSSAPCFEVRSKRASKLLAAFMGLLPEDEEQDDDDSGDVGNKICEECGSDLVLRNGRYGIYLACSSRSCDSNRSPKSATELTRRAKEQGAKCPECGGEVAGRRARRGGYFVGCASYRKTGCERILRP